MIGTNKMQKLKIKNQKSLFNNAGFTLVELIVVIVVLLFVVGIAVSIFVSITRYQRIILSEQELLNQSSFVLERMSKALRMAGKDFAGNCLLDSFGTSYRRYNYLLTRPINGIYTGIKFINRSDNDTCQEFYLDSTDTNNPVLKEIKGGNPWVAITSDKFMINSIRFGINGGDGSVNGAIGAAGDNGIQPMITIFLDIEEKKFQTTISQRDLNAQQ